MFQSDIVVYENMLYVKVMYFFTEQVDFKISVKLILVSKGYSLNVSIFNILGGWTHAHTHTDIAGKSQFRHPGERPGLKLSFLKHYTYKVFLVYIDQFST